jgi:lysyl-tRNA synthetase class 2
MENVMEFNSLEQNRLEKLLRLRQSGNEPFPTRAERTHTSQQAINLFEAAETVGSKEAVRVALAGRLRWAYPIFFARQ